MDTPCYSSYFPIFQIKKKKKGKEKPEVQRLVSLWQRWNLTQGFWSAVIYSLLLVPKAWELTTPQDDRV
jgi:hypothetical protein